MSHMKKIEQKIVNWIKKKVKESHTKGLVVGLSGGIDSAIVAVLARKALGKKNVIGVIMPCEFGEKDEQDALLIAKKFSIRTETIELTSVFYKFTNTIPYTFLSEQISSSNLKARLRMCLLYYIANSSNYLVCGTGNKTEIAIGYFTKYGDGGVDIEPIGDLYKKDVRELAKYLGIPQTIIDKAPSAGLYEGQTDEKEIGLTYEQLDTCLNFYKSGYGYSINNKNYHKVLKMIKNSKHKRDLPPICKL